LVEWIAGQNEVKSWTDIRPVKEQIFEVDIVMDIRMYYASGVVLQTIWPKEKGEGPVSSFVSTVMLLCISDNVTPTNRDHTEIDSRLLVSFCYANGVVLYDFL
jgi:hypothetical protein